MDRQTNRPTGHRATTTRFTRLQKIKLAFSSEHVVLARIKPVRFCVTGYTQKRGFVCSSVFLFCCAFFPNRHIAPPCGSPLRSRKTPCCCYESHRASLELALKPQAAWEDDLRELPALGFPSSSVGAAGWDLGGKLTRTM